MANRHLQGDTAQTLLHDVSFIINIFAIVMGIVKYFDSSVFDNCNSDVHTFQKTFYILLHHWV